MTKNILLTCSVLFAFIAIIGCNNSSATSDQFEIASLYIDRLKLIQSQKTPDQMAEAYISVVDKDALWMPPDSPPIIGTQAIRSWATEFFRHYSMRVDSISFVNIDVCCNLAIRRWRSFGKYISNKSADTTTYNQKYIDILQKDLNGNWKITHHMWNSSSKEKTIWD